MVEELIQIMMARWNLPEAQVREFMDGLFPESSSATATLDDIREKTADLLQTVILENKREP